MTETKQFGLSAKEAREISHANSLPGELKRVANFIKVYASKGQYKALGIPVKLRHVDAIADSLRDAGYVVKSGALTFERTERVTNIYWEDPI